MPFKNPEAKKAYDKARRATNKERVDATKQVWETANKARRAASNRATHLKRKYDLPPEVYDYSVIKQLNLCGICGDPETTERNGRVKALAVDHCHDTGIVRGFLCSACNLALGKMRDNPAHLRAAADYLDAHNTATRYSAQIAKRLQIPTQALASPSRHQSVAQSESLTS
jgi:hypothetical protein